MDAYPTNHYLLYCCHDELQPRITPGEYVVIELTKEVPIDEMDMHMALVRHRGTERIARVDIEWTEDGIEKRPARTWLENLDRSNRVEVLEDDDFEIRGVVLFILPQQILLSILAGLEVIPTLHYDQKGDEPDDLDNV